MSVADETIILGTDDNEMNPATFPPDWIKTISPAECNSALTSTSGSFEGLGTSLAYTSYLVSHCEGLHTRTEAEAIVTLQISVSVSLGGRKLERD